MSLSKELVSFALKAAMCARNRCPTFVVLKGQSPMSEIYSVNTEDTTLTDTILAFVEGLK